MMTIELTENEAAVLRFYLRQALIDADGSAAIGLNDGSSARALRSIMNKIGDENGKTK